MILAAHRSRRTAHAFAIGQPVRLKGGFARLANSNGVYRVTRTLPLTGGSPQYRIRSEDDAHERVTTQDNLEAVHLSGTHSDLAEAVFRS
ncbi:conserved hypothetical protein [uncultured Alphaproteobacteria bacterium]|jgi:hypothetical protein|uniref:Uncharacterized protein n=1 Tax=uncultured Alphaproteobacteria bacterium TaxID=91750 RepID=A0A212JRT0_9PROT|nr:conserved hypothetical protein [uncultured Alphaproteobacteria bacterium]